MIPMISDSIANLIFELKNSFYCWKRKIFTFSYKMAGTVKYEKNTTVPWTPNTFLSHFIIESDAFLNQPLLK